MTDGRLARRLLIAAGLSLGVAAFAYVLMVRTKLGQRFDNAALFGSFQQNPSARINDGFFVARWSATAFIAALVVVVTVAVWRRRPGVGVALAVTAVLTVLLTHWLKIDVLPRPTLVTSDFIQFSNTYPSGHTATAVVAALVLVVITPPAYRGVVALVAGSYAAVIAQDVQTAGWHRPSDAIGAAFVAFALVAIVSAGIAQLRPVGNGPQRTHRAAYVVLALAALISAVICVIDAGHALNTLRHTSSSIAPSRLNDAHQFSIWLTVLVVASLMAALLALLGPADLSVRRVATAEDSPGAPAPSTSPVR